MGRTIVCMNEALIPASASTATTTRGLGIRVSRRRRAASSMPPPPHPPYGALPRGVRTGAPWQTVATRPHDPRQQERAAHPKVDGPSRRSSRCQRRACAARLIGWSLSTQTQTLDQRPVAADVDVLQVAEQPATLAHEEQQTTT